MGLIDWFPPGSWWVSSETDPRWKGNGHTESCGGGAIPREAQAHIDRLKQTLGEPPDDLTYGYMKD